MSTRKPHNDLAGYVCERKSFHPKLPGYFVIFDKNNGGAWVTGSDGQRWAVAHLKADDSIGCLTTFSSLPSARSIMIDAATGGNTCDFGQHEEQ